MSWHSIYDKQGKITNTLLVSKGVDLNLNVPNNHSYIKGKYNHSEYYIKDGAPKPYPERPSRFHYFDFTLEEWVEDTDAALSAAWRELRAKRDRLLLGSDHTQLPDAPVADAAAWASYRQALRDLPANTTDPRSPAWPQKPE